jgi:hypothetical protein
MSLVLVVTAFLIGSDARLPVSICNPEGKAKGADLARSIDERSSLAHAMEAVEGLLRKARSCEDCDQRSEQTRGGDSGIKAIDEASVVQAALLREEALRLQAELKIVQYFHENGKATSKEVDDAKVLSNDATTKYCQFAVHTLVEQ